MKIDGLNEFRNRTKAMFRTQQLVKFMSGEPVAKARKGRGKDKGPRRQEEAELRKEVIKELRKRGCFVKRVENSICGELGRDVTDLIVFNLTTKRGGFMELKTPTGIMDEGQKKFREACLICNINHWICRSVYEAINAVC